MCCSSNSLEIIRACEDLCWNHDKSTHIEQKPTELPKTRSIEQKKLPLRFWFRLDLQKSGGGGGEEAMECFCYLRNVHTGIQKKHLIKEDVPLNLMVQQYSAD